jgi:putative ATP-binding cassette transporter
MKLLAILLRTSRRLALLTILFGILSGASSATLVALINSALGRGAEASTTDIALPFVAMAVVALLSRMFSQLLLTQLQQSILMDLRLRISRHLITTSLRKLEEAGSHRMLNSMLQDTILLGQGVATLPEFFINIAVTLGALAYMAWLSWPIFLTMLGFIVVGQLTYAIPARMAVRYQNMAREENHNLFRRLMNLVEGAKELRLNSTRRRAFFDTELTPAVALVRRLFVRSDTFFAMATSWGMFLYVVVIGLLLLVVPRFGAIPQAELLGAVLVVLYLQHPLNSISFAFPNLRRAEVSMMQIEQLGMKLTPERSGDPSLALQADMAQPSTFDSLELTGITHTYRHEKDDEKFTLGPINLTLQPGELLFLVGGNGSGKTTLAKLLTGLYTPETGEIRLNGKPVTAEALDSYRQHFASVFFDFCVFDRLLGLSSPELLKQAEHYLEQLHLNHKVRIQEGGKLSTTQLSQGQRKRLALLVAYLEDRPVYVFDEWAADQDPMFKEIFYKQILPDMKKRGKAVFVISHDDRYFHLADRLVRLEAGQIISNLRTDAKQPDALSA